MGVITKMADGILIAKVVWRARRTIDLCLANARAIVVGAWRARGTIGICIAAVWALWQYHEHIVESRISAALDFRKQLRASPEVYKAWRDVAVTAVEDSPERRNLETNDVFANEQFRYKLGKANRQSLDVILSIYDDAWDCVQGDVCDDGAVVQLFGPEAKVLLDNYYVYLHCTRIREGGDGYAFGLQSIFERHEHRKAREPLLFGHVINVSDCSLFDEDWAATP